MSAREVLLFGLVFGRGTIVAGALFGLLWELGIVDRAGAGFFGAGSAGRGFVRRVLRAAFDEAAVPLQPLLATFVFVVLMIGLFRLLSAVWTFIGYYGFTLTRTGDDLRCEYGLLTRVTSTIPVHRIQKVTVREGPWHRLGHRVSVGVQTAGGRVENPEAGHRSWLAPLVPQSALQGLLEGIVPDAASDVQWQPVHPRGARRKLARLMVFVVPVSIALWMALGWWALLGFSALSAWAFLHANRSVSALQWAVSPETVQFASGWIWRSRLVAPLTKIQVVSRHESPFDRRHGMATVFADTAGRALAGYAIRVPYMPAPIARAFAERLSAAASRTSFRW